MNHMNSGGELPKNRRFPVAGRPGSEREFGRQGLRCSVARPANLSTAFLYSICLIYIAMICDTTIYK